MSLDPDQPTWKFLNPMLILNIGSAMRWFRSFDKPFQCGSTVTRRDGIFDARDYVRVS